MSQIPHIIQVELLTRSSPMNHRHYNVSNIFLFICKYIIYFPCRQQQWHSFNSSSLRDSLDAYRHSFKISLQWFSISFYFTFHNNFFSLFSASKSIFFYLSSYYRVHSFAFLAFHLFFVVIIFVDFYYDFRNDKFPMNEFDFSDIRIYNFRMIWAANNPFIHLSHTGEHKRPDFLAIVAVVVVIEYVCILLLLLVFFIYFNGIDLYVNAPIHSIVHMRPIFFLNGASLCHCNKLNINSCIFRIWILYLIDFHSVSVLQFRCFFFFVFILRSTTEKMECTFSEYIINYKCLTSTRGREREKECENNTHAYDVSFNRIEWPLLVIVRLNRIFW